MKVENFGKNSDFENRKKIVYQFICDDIYVPMKIKELAEKAGISQATLAKMKKDGATISSDVLVKICTALDCTVDDIFEIVSNDGE